MRNPVVLFDHYFDDVCRWLAARIHPETAKNAENYKLLLADVREVAWFIGPNIPEVKQVLNWLMGKNWARGSNDGAYGLLLYPSYMKYRSLTHFKEVLLNEYKRTSKT